jgi:hypothetical protein
MQIACPLENLAKAERVPKTNNPINTFFIKTPRVMLVKQIYFVLAFLSPSFRGKNFH